MDVDVMLASALIVRDRELLLLYRSDHGYYETPGGKLEAGDCEDPENPTEKDLLRCALRELEEELDCTAEPFGQPLIHEFTIPDGRRARIFKFPMRFVSGSCEVREPIFEHARFIPIEDLGSEPISQDLHALKDEIEALFDTMENER